MKKGLVLVVLAMLLPVLAGCGGEAAPGGILSGFETTDLEGNPMDASLLTGHRLTLVNVWATYGSSCQEEMQALTDLAAEYRERGLLVLGIVSDGAGQETLAKSITQEAGAHYINLLPSEDLENLLSQLRDVPTTIFVDESGCQVGSTYVGALGRDKLAKIIEELLGQE